MLQNNPRARGQGQWVEVPMKQVGHKLVITEAGYEHMEVHIVDLVLHILSIP